MTERVDAPPWRILQVQATIGAVLFGFVGFAVLLGALPARLTDLGYPQGAAGVATTATLVATIAVQVATPALLSRVSNRLLLAVGLVLLGAPAPLYAVVESMSAIVGLSVLRGAGFALITVIGALNVAEAVTPNRRGTAIGLYGTAGAIPTAVGPGIGAVLTEHGMFTLTCVIAAVPVLGLPACRFVGGGTTGASGDHEGAGAALRACLPACLLLFVVTMAGGGLLTLLAATSLPLPVTAALLVFGLTSVLARFLVGGLADQVGARRLILPLTVTIVLGLVLLGPALAPGRSVLLLAAVALAGIGYGALQSVTLTVGLMSFVGRDAATVSTAWNVAFDGGTALGAGVLTWAAAGSIGPAGAFVASAVLIGVVGLLAAFIRTGPAGHRAR